MMTMVKLFICSAPLAVNDSDNDGELAFIGAYAWGYADRPCVFAMQDSLRVSSTVVRNIVPRIHYISREA